MAMANKSQNTEYIKENGMMGRRMGVEKWCMIQEQIMTVNGRAIFFKEKELTKTKPIIYTMGHFKQASSMEKGR